MDGAPSSPGRLRSTPGCPASPAGSGAALWGRDRDAQGRCLHGLAPRPPPGPAPAPGPGTLGCVTLGDGLGPGPPSTPGEVTHGTGFCHTGPIACCPEPQPARLAVRAPRCVRGPVQQRARQGRWRRKVTQTPREPGPQGRAPRVPGSPCGRDRWPALPGGQASGWRTSSRPMAQSSVTGPAQGPTGLLRPFQQADLHGPPGAVLPSPACAAEQLDPRRSPWGGDSWAGVERKSRPREPVP